MGYKCMSDYSVVFVSEIAECNITPSRLSFSKGQADVYVSYGTSTVLGFLLYIIENSYSFSSSECELFVIERTQIQTPGNSNFSRSVNGHQKSLVLEIKIYWRQISYRQVQICKFSTFRSFALLGTETVKIGIKYYNTDFLQIDRIQKMLLWFFCKLINER